MLEIDGTIVFIIGVMIVLTAVAFIVHREAKG